MSSSATVSSRHATDPEPTLLQITQPGTLPEALAERAAAPEAVVVAGGTGVMVARNAGRADAPLLDLSRVRGLADTSRADGVVRLGAGVTYTQVIEGLADVLPGLAAAARTVASRSIRNRATLVGALVIADPSADVLAALVAAEAQVEVEGPGGARRVDAGAFVRGPGRPDLLPDELVTALLVPEAPGPVAYAKAGARNAMARAVCGVAVALDPARRTVRIAVVGAAPVAVRAHAAEELAATLVRWELVTPGRGAEGGTRPSADGGPIGGPGAPDGAGSITVAPAALAEVGALVAAAVDPVGDARGSAAHRRQVAGVLATRALARACAQLEPAGAAPC